MSNHQTQPWAAKWGLLISFVAVFALVFGLYLPGCSDNPATSPDTLSQDETSFFEEPLDDAEYARLVDLAAETEEYLWGEEFMTAADGGALIVGTNGNFHEFVVPPGALPYDCVVSVEIIKVESKKDEVALIYDFGPDHIRFNIPCYLVVDPAKLLGKKATCVDFYYLDESFIPPKWLLYGAYCIDGPGGLVTIPVDHFSRYGID